MSNEEKDRLIGEKIMGWHLAKNQSIGMEQWYDKDNLFEETLVDWHPSTDLNQCHDAEEKMTEEMRESYGDHLIKRVESYLFSGTDRAFRIAHAAAEQKTDAMVAMLKELEGKSI